MSANDEAAVAAVAAVKLKRGKPAGGGFPWSTARVFFQIVDFLLDGDPEQHAKNFPKTGPGLGSYFAQHKYRELAAKNPNVFKSAGAYITKTKNTAVQYAALMDSLTAIKNQTATERQADDGVAVMKATAKLEELRRKNI